MAKQYLDIMAVGGICFHATLIANYDSSRSIGLQEGRLLGQFEFGSLDSDGQYNEDDDEIVAAARAEYDIDETIEAGVR